MEFTSKITELSIKVNSVRSSRKFKNIFGIFDFSLKQKIKEYNFYFEKINGFKEEDYRINETKSQQDEKTVTVINIKAIDREKLMFDLNFWLDGYFFTGLSVLDTLAHLIDHIYKVYSPNANIYINRINAKLINKNKRWKIIKVLKKIERRNSWYKNFSRYRNIIIHASVISREIPSIYRTISGNDRIEELKPIYLPHIEKGNLQKIIEKPNYEINNLIKNFDQKLEKFIEEIYNSNLEDIENKNKLPM